MLYTFPAFLFQRLLWPLFHVRPRLEAPQPGPNRVPNTSLKWSTQPFTKRTPHIRTINKDAFPPSFLSCIFFSLVLLLSIASLSGRACATTFVLRASFESYGSLLLLTRTNMSFLSKLLIHARVQRRRHRHLAVLAVSLVLVSLFSALFLWNSDASVSLVTNPDTRCGWLPAFICDWTEAYSQRSSKTGEPFDPLKSTKESSGEKPKISSPAVAEPLTKANQAKLDFIQSSYSGKSARKLAIAHEFYENIMKAILESRPKCAKLDNYPNGHCIAERIETTHDGELRGQVYLEKYLLRFLELSDFELQLMIDSHKFALENLPDKAPEGLYKGDGIVYVGGGKFNWLALLSIRSLRAQNCKLPVEVFIPTLEEFELELCSRIFPVMNARCVHLPTALFGEKLRYARQFRFLGYQYKSLAIMLLSFENVLLLDSDNVPTYAPDHFFVREPFVSSGLIVWPDFWHRSTSPDYFRIAGVDVSRTKLLPLYNEHLGEYVEQNNKGGKLDWENCPFHERVGSIPDPSSESGQLMISKKTHMKALLFALYYNLYGPDYYYPLFSQGAQGEGDKETFLAATIATHKPYYQVGKFLDALGNLRNNAFNGNAMGQYDPVQDYEWNQERKKLRQKLSGQEYEDAANKLQTPKIIFVHANTPKLNPWKCFLEHDTVDEEGQRYRLYGLGMKVRTGTDFEQDQWNYMDQLLCDLRLNVEVFSKVDRNALCEEIRKHRDWLVSTEDTLE